MLKRQWTEKLIYGHEFAGRFTQDSPILPDVWIQCAEHPTRRHDLLITPYIEAGVSQMNAGHLSRELRDRLVADGIDANRLCELSMGMSHDFEVAIQEGATLVRVGTAIFGKRTVRT